MALSLVLNGFADELEASESQATLRFFDGSQLHGQLSGLDKKGSLRWRHPYVDTPIAFDLTNIESVRFQNMHPATTNTQSACLFSFKNGDELFGELLSLKDNKVTYATDIGGPMASNRTALDAITFFSSAYRILYQGPKDVAEWQQGNRRNSQTWQFRDNAYTTSGMGTLGRDFGLNSSCSLEFDLSWGGPFYLTLSTYVEDITRDIYAGNFYKFILRPGSVLAQRYQRGAQAVTLGTAAEVPEMLRKNEARLTFRFNQEANNIMLFVNDRFTHVWQDPRGFNAGGSGILFSKSSANTSVTLSRIQVSTWEGNILPAGLTNNVVTNDFIYLSNNDKAAGSLTAIENNAVAFDTAVADFEIPLPRVTHLQFKSDASTTNLVSDDYVRAHFQDGSAVTFKLQQWTQDAVQGVSDSLGAITFRPETIQHLEFNPARAKNNPETDNEYW